MQTELSSTEMQQEPSLSGEGNKLYLLSLSLLLLYIYTVTQRTTASCLFRIHFNIKRNYILKILHKHP
jgi:hypothetical protein